MNMQVSKLLLAVVLLAVICVGCKKEVVQNVAYDNVIYDINNEVIYATSSDKTKQKTPLQFISILYTDLFGIGIPPNDLNEMGTLFSSIGDKNIARELILSNWMNDANVQLPMMADMRANPEEFVEKVFIKFYLRKPDAYEKKYFVDYINDDLNITPEFVYLAFALSNEYNFY